MDNNFQNVLLTTDRDCNLSDFLVSLDLLEVHKYMDWDLDWNDTNLLLDQHGIVENMEYGRSSLTSVSPVESCEENYESPSRSTPTNEVIFKRRLQSFDQSRHSSPHYSNFSVTLGWICCFYSLLISFVYFYLSLRFQYFIQRSCRIKF